VATLFSEFGACTSESAQKQAEIYKESIVRNETANFEQTVANLFKEAKQSKCEFTGTGRKVVSCCKTVGPGQKFCVPHYKLLQKFLITHPIPEKYVGKVHYQPFLSKKSGPPLDASEDTIQKLDPKHLQKLSIKLRKDHLSRFIPFRQDVACPISQELLFGDPNEEVVCLPCYHFAHLSVISYLLSSSENPVCPLCRSKFNQYYSVKTGEIYSSRSSRPSRPSRPQITLLPSRQQSSRRRNHAPAYEGNVYEDPSYEDLPDHVMELD